MNRVRLWFLLLGAVVLANAALVAVNVFRLTENDRSVRRSQEVITALDDVFLTVKDAETGQRGFLITGEESYLKPYDEALTRLHEKMTALRQLIDNNQDHRAHLQVLQNAIDLKLAELKKTVDLRRARGEEKEKGDGSDPAFQAARAVVMTNQGKEQMEAIVNAVATIRQKEESILQLRAEESLRSRNVALLSMAVGTVFSLALLGVVQFLVRRDRELREQTALAVREQREWFEVTFRSLGDGILATDANGNVTLMNPVSQELTGWTQADASGRPIQEVFRIINEDTHHIVENPVERVLREGVVVGLANHSILIARNGVERPIDDSGAPIRDANGRVIGAVLIFRDVTEKRQAEETRRHLAAIIESSDDVIVSKSLEGIILSWNRGAEKIFGFTAAEVVGRPITLIVPPERLAEEEDILRRLRRGEKVDHFETVRMRKDGIRIDVAVTSSPVLDSSGRVVGASKVARDITEQKRLREELRRRVEALAETDRRKDQFLAMLAHELRNPLAPIRNSLYLLSYAGTNKAVTEQARAMIERQVELLTRLVDDLLDVSRITRGKITLHRESVELADAVTRGIETSRPLLDARSHQLSVSLPTEPVVLEADKVRLAQVITNLLNNAAKFTPEGGHIEVTAQAANGEVCLRVRDSGVGIAAELLPHVFDLFIQADRSLDRTQGGLGIGLTLVRSLVEMHGGKVEAISEGPGKGSEFVIRLPLAPTPHSAGESGKPRKDESLPARRVLIVDDNTDAADSLALLLQASGHQVQTAYEGRAALTAAQNFRPDVVFLDIGLPGMNGYEVAQHLRREPTTAGALIVALTGYGQEEDRRRGKEAGFDRHIIKPVDPEVLTAILSNTALRA